MAKVHADAPASGEWRGRRWGVFRARLALIDGALKLHTMLGTRSVALPCAIEIGSLVAQRSDVILEHVATTVKTGWYLRLGDRITIGCKTAANVKDHWRGWTQGKRRRVPDLWVDRRVLVEIEYALVAAGALQPLAC